MDSSPCLSSASPPSRFMADPCTPSPCLSSASPPSRFGSLHTQESSPTPTPENPSSFFSDPFDPLISVRIVNSDFYMNSPLPGVDPTTSPFRFNAQIQTLPVIRVYGSTRAGQKALLHVHGVFPYIYIPFEKDLQSRFKDSDDTALHLFLIQLANSIDKALNISMGKGSSNPEQHVFRIVVVRGKPFYGFHEEEEEFLKIYVYNPNFVKKMVELLQAGAIMNRGFQPHEAHIPFLLQFFIDFNLYGMNFLDLSSAKFRPFLQPETSPYASLCDTLDLRFMGDRQEGWWDETTTPKDMMLSQDSVFAKRHGKCELELDAVAIDILNRKELETNPEGQNPGLAALWEDERQRRRNNNESSFVESEFINEDPRDRLGGPTELRTESDRFFLQKLHEKLREEEEKSQEAKRPQRREEANRSQRLASQVLSHEDDFLNQSDVDAEDPDAVVDEDSILEVLSQSSRRRNKSSQLEKTFSGDETLIDILAGLAGSEGEEEEEEGEEGKDGAEGKEEEEMEEDEAETVEMTQVLMPSEAELEEMETRKDVE